jgi:hypothetical protein
MSGPDRFAVMSRWPKPSTAGYPRACERSSGGAVFADWAAVDRGGVRMRTPMSCKLVGRWPIVEADIWDRQYLDLCGQRR